MNREAQRLLDSYGFKHIVASKMIDNYSFEDRKLIEIVKATYFSPKVVVVDETTTALSQSGREELFTVMNRIKKRRQYGHIHFARPRGGDRSYRSHIHPARWQARRHGEAAARRAPAS